MDNDTVQTYRRIVSTMFNDGVINMDFNVLSLWGSFSVFYCAVPMGLILYTLMCCPCGAHILYFNVLSPVGLILCTLTVLGLLYGWSKIVFGVERYFQLYRDQLFYLVLNATFSIDLNLTIFFLYIQLELYR
jgi:hypothetical protein